MADDDIQFGPGPLKGLRVLVAEDNAIIADTIGLMLLEEGARLIGPCRSVEDACRLLGSCRVDFVLVDPELADGFADAVAGEARERRIPFALLTAYRALPTNMDEGAEEILRKPLNRSKLITLLARFS